MCDLNGFQQAGTDTPLRVLNALYRNPSPQKKQRKHGYCKVKFSEGGIFYPLRACGTLAYHVDAVTVI